MPRANRQFSAGLVWHLTHRCHRKSFLLRFSKDRRRWRQWLFEARRRYGLSILNYIATSNHVHLLVFDRGEGEIARSMQLAAGRTAQEFNRRKGRKGAFWEDRYHATAVESDGHLLRCMTYIDLNMVRAGRVCHPGAWDVSGFSEIQAPWHRKGIIDYPCIRQLLMAESDRSLAGILLRSAEEACEDTIRDPVWTESVGVGSDAFIARLGGIAGTTRRMPTAEDGSVGNSRHPEQLA